MMFRYDTQRAIYRTRTGAELANFSGPGYHSGATTVVVPVFDDLYLVNTHHPIVRTKIWFLPANTDNIPAIPMLEVNYYIKHKRSRELCRSGL